MTAHLSDDEYKVETRNEELQTVLTSLLFDAPKEQKPYQNLTWQDTESDAVILAGDLNYRVYTPLTKAKPMLINNHYDELLATDELLTEIKVKSLPSILNEGPI